jgi:hypothetical protein
VGGGGAGGKTDMSFCVVLCQWPMLWIRVLFFFLYVQGLHGAVGVGNQLLQNSLVRPREQKSAIATNLSTYQLFQTSSLLKDLRSAGNIQTSARYAIKYIPFGCQDRFSGI